MKFAEFRDSPQEQDRIRDLLALIPRTGGSGLDVGTRDGYVSMRLTEYFDRVTALDLERPGVEHARIETVAGDVTALQFPDDSFDLVLCAEVLEHIPACDLGRACAELSRVAKGHVLVGVPYKQDIRAGRTTCGRCGGKNPPWGHVNAFDEPRLERLFPDLAVERVSYVGQSRVRTNFLSAYLMDLAGNPFGTYMQEEPCIHCGDKLQPPGRRTLAQRLCTRAAHYLQRLQRLFVPAQANWVHILFRKGGPA